MKKMIELLNNLPTSQPVSAHGDYVSKLSIEISIMMVCSIWSNLRSKDPNTKVGAAVYDHKTGSIHLGYNGFPSGFPDSSELWNNRNKDDSSKYNYVVHAEVNAIRKAYLANCNMSESVLFITHFPCRNCSKDVIVPSGIKKVMYLDDYPEDNISRTILESSGVIIVKLDIDKLSLG